MEVAWSLSKKDASFYSQVQTAKAALIISANIGVLLIQPNFLHGKSLNYSILFPQCPPYAK